MSRPEQSETPLSEQGRQPMLSETDINYILLNGAQIALTKLKRSQKFDDSLFYYAEIGAYLEVSLSRGAGITDETRVALESIHRQATYEHMNHNKALRSAS